MSYLFGNIFNYLEYIMYIKLMLNKCVCTRVLLLVLIKNNNFVPPVIFTKLSKT